MRLLSVFPQTTLHPTDLFAVRRVGEVNEVIVIHLLGVDDITVLLLTQVLWVDAVSSQKLLVGHAEGLADRLGYELGLQKPRGREGERDTEPWG